MTQQITKLKNHRAEKLGLGDSVSKKFFRYKKTLPVATSIKAIGEYLKIMARNLFNGYEHELPNHFGKLSIVKMPITDKKGIKKTKGSKYHPNHKFRFVLNSMICDKHGMSFFPSKILKHELERRLEHISTDYKMYYGK